MRAYAYQCRYCGQWLTFDTAEIDHATPVARGGLTVLANLRASCRPCNREKSDKTETEYLAYRRIQAALRLFEKRN